MIVHSLDPITIVGGSTVDRSDLNKTLSIAPVVVAADGGARHLLQDGPVPAAVIGDFDSLPDEARTQFSSCLHHVSEQDTTDFEKVVDRVTAPVLICLGFLGGRIDHSFAALNLLARKVEQPLILVGEEDVVMRIPPNFSAQLPQGTPFALLPMAPSKVWSKGLKWDMDGADLAPDGLVSSSNEVVGPDVSVRSEGCVLLTLPKEFLECATSVLLGQ